jgi:polysaccharide export outer membrane protein
MRTLVVTALVLTLLGPGAALAQTGSSQAQPPKPTPPATRPAAPGPTVTAIAVAGVPTEPGFTIGPEDVLGVLFWRDQDMSGDVTVRPDGMITLPLVRDIKAAGLTPTALADRIQAAVREYVTDASVTVVVRQMNSRKAFITGEVARPGAYSLGSSSMTVMQLIALAGGLTEFAQPKDITVMRVEAGKTTTFAFDYKNVARGKSSEQNIVLKPGDTVVVPER